MNPESGDIRIQYIVIQDQVLMLTDGETLVPGQDSVIIQVQHDSVAYHDFALEISEGSSSRISNETPGNEWPAIKGQAAEEVKLVMVQGNQLSIELLGNPAQECDVWLFDSGGRIIKSFPHVSSGIFDLSSESIVPGIYYCCIKLGEIQDCRKVFIQ